MSDAIVLKETIQRKEVLFKFVNWFSILWGSKLKVKQDNLTK